MWRTYDSYVNPNAKCPVCGRSVFFYQSPEGGRVFFDESGPPWPKHPCTDNSPPGSSRSIIKATGYKAPSTSGPSFAKPPVHSDVTTATPTTPSSPRYNWLVAGWMPFLLSSINSVSNELLRLSGTYGGKNLDIYVLKGQLSIPTDPQDILSRSLMHMKPISENRYRLALLTPSLRPLEIVGYLSSLDAVPIRLSNQRKNRRNQRRRR